MSLRHLPFIIIHTINLKTINMIDMIDINGAKRIGRRRIVPHIIEPMTRRICHGRQIVTKTISTSIIPNDHSRRTKAHVYSWQRIPDFRTTNQKRVSSTVRRTAATLGRRKTCYRIQNVNHRANARVTTSSKICFEVRRRAI
jgi:hypothetical protein